MFDKTVVLSFVCKME